MCIINKILQIHENVLKFQRFCVIVTITMCEKLVEIIFLA